LCGGRRALFHPSLVHLRPDAPRRRVSPMSIHQRLSVQTVADVSIVHFVDRKILDEANIQELGRELFHLVEEEQRKKLLLNFSNVEFLSSAALGKLITLDKKVKKMSGQLKLSNIRPEIYEVFAITKLNKLFDIKDDEADALAAF
jgi:anti-sigma B factor antagonist